MQAIAAELLHYLRSLMSKDASTPRENNKSLIAAPSLQPAPSAKRRRTEESLCTTCYLYPERIGCPPAVERPAVLSAAPLDQDATRSTNKTRLCTIDCSTADLLGPLAYTRESTRLACLSRYSFERRRCRPTPDGSGKVGLSSRDARACRARASRAERHALDMLHWACTCTRYMVPPSLTFDSDIAAAPPCSAKERTLHFTAI